MRFKNLLLVIIVSLVTMLVFMCTGSETDTNVRKKVGSRIISGEFVKFDYPVPDGLITDPDELGDLVPGGLAGGDGYCFDVYANDEKMFAYLKERLMEAYQAAASA